MATPADAQQRARVKIDGRLCWALVTRGTIEQLSATELEKVRELNFAGLHGVRCRQVETNALFAIATKPNKRLGNRRS